MCSTFPNWVKELDGSKIVTQNLSTKVKDIPSLPGFEASRSETYSTGEVKKAANQKEIDALEVQKAWQIALQPLKSVPMNFFMSYMSGTSLQIIPIMTALMLLSGPIKAIFALNQAFKPVMGNQATKNAVIVAKFIYIFGQAVLMFIGVRKLNQMGLIPNTKSDWLAWEQLTQYNDGLNAFAF